MSCHLLDITADYCSVPVYPNIVWPLLLVCYIPQIRYDTVLFFISLNKIYNTGNMKHLLFTIHSNGVYY